MHKVSEGQCVVIKTIQIAVAADIEEEFVDDKISALLSENGAHDEDVIILDWRYQGTDVAVIAPDDLEEGEIFNLLPTVSVEQCGFKLDTRDAYLQKVIPTAMMPRFSALEPLSDDGHRFIVGSDGIYLEVKRPWLHLCKMIARQTAVAMPYGTPAEFQTIAFEFPSDLLGLFISEARSNLPDEFGAWIVYDAEEGNFSYLPLKSTHATPDFLEVIRPELAEHQHLFCDLHSHGSGEAFFSSIDNKDDASEVKISVVYGNLDQAEPMVVSRLCCLGAYQPISL